MFKFIICHYYYSFIYIFTRFYIVVRINMCVLIKLTLELTWLTLSTQVCNRISFLNGKKIPIIIKLASLITSAPTRLTHSSIRVLICIIDVHKFRSKTTGTIIVLILIKLSCKTGILLHRNFLLMYFYITNLIFLLTEH